MYRTGKQYKIQLISGIVYTAIILEEDNTQIRIQTVRNEEIIITKEQIRQATLLNRTEQENEKNNQNLQLR